MKLTAEKKKEIEVLLQQNLSYKEIAKRVGVSVSLIYKATNQILTNSNSPRTRKRRGSGFRTPNDQNRFYISHY
ncbi:MAG: helix-turn-helix domain-containing protein [Parasporobacterium sp.]|nr:helix-turn-helix domain-containing protein [Parasporobacterium sp.]